MVITAEVFLTNFHSDITSQPWTYLDPWNRAAQLVESQNHVESLWLSCLDSGENMWKSNLKAKIRKKSASFLISRSIDWMGTNYIILTSLLASGWEYLRSPSKTLSFVAGYLADWPCLWYPVIISKGPYWIQVKSPTPTGMNKKKTVIYYDTGM